MRLSDRIMRVLEYAETPMLVEEIAHVLQARSHDVRKTLRDNPSRFSAPLRVPGRSPKAKGYLLAWNARDGWEKAA